MNAGQKMTSPSSPNRGLGIRQVLIRDVDTATGVVLATDVNGAQIELPLRIRRVNIDPVAGQTWLVDTALGFPSLAAWVDTS